MTAISEYFMPTCPRTLKLELDISFEGHMKVILLFSFLYFKQGFKYEVLFCRRSLRMRGAEMVPEAARGGSRRATNHLGRTFHGRYAGHVCEWWSLVAH